MMKFWDWDSEIGNGWHACSVPTNFSPFYYLPENKFLPLLLFAGKQIVANGSTLHWERRRKKRKQIPNWRRKKLILSWGTQKSGCTFFWSLVNMYGLNGILYALGAKNLITLFPQKLETVTVRISMENLGSSLNSRLSTTGWKERKVKKKTKKWIDNK